MASAVAVTKVSAHVLTQEELDKVKSEIRAEVLAEVKADVKATVKSEVKATEKPEVASDKPARRSDIMLDGRSASAPRSGSSSNGLALQAQGPGKSAIDQTSYARMTSVLESLLTQNERTLMNLNGNGQINSTGSMNGMNRMSMSGGMNGGMNMMGMNGGMNMMGMNGGMNMMGMNGGMNMMGMNGGMNMMGMNGGMNMMGMNGGMNMMGMNGGMNQSSGLNFGFQLGGGMGLGTQSNMMMPNSYYQMNSSMPYTGMGTQNYYSLGTGNSLYGSSYGNSSLATNYFGLGQTGTSSLYGTGTTSGIAAGQRQSIAGMVTY